MANKVKFGLKNVHYAPIIFGEDGEIDWETPIPIPGAVSMSLESQGEEVEFEADDSLYYTSYSYTGKKGTLEVALIPDHFRKKIFKEVEDETDHVLIEYANTEPAPFALLYETTGDKGPVRGVFYHTSAGRPGSNASTTGKTKTPQPDSLSITTVPLSGGETSIKTTENTPKLVFDNWFKKVWRPAAPASPSGLAAGEPVSPAAQEV